MRCWRRYVSLVVLVAVALFLSIQTATHSIFLGTATDPDNPESPVDASRHEFAAAPNNETVAGNSDARNSDEQREQRKQIHLHNVKTNRRNSTKREKSTPTSLNVQGSFLVKPSPVCMPSDDRDDHDEEWWNAVRIGNIIDDPRLSPRNWYPTILDPWSEQVVNQTICHVQSRFLDSTDTHRFSAYDWMVRLTYLGIYLHQHLPAVKEIQARHSCAINDTKISNIVSISNDYRCDPNTKYLVVALPNKGAGATFRSGAAAALLAGLAMNRVVLFVNGRRYGSLTMRSTWHLATTSKCPRGDYQCYFLPTSPCVLTEEEIKNATHIHKITIVDSWNLMSAGTVHSEVSNERVVVLDGSPAPVYLRPTAKQRIQHRIYELVKELATKYNVPSQILDELQSTSTNKLNGMPPSRHYDHSNSPMHHAALLYSLRPNWKFREELENMVQKAIPKDNFHPEWTFGVPIRASDKCESESTCLTFDQYMAWAHQRYNKYSTNKTKSAVASLVLTSESKMMMKARHQYTKVSPESKFPFRFVVNVDDATQGTGTPRKYRGKDKDAHKVMLSTMAALKLQLMPKYSVANCCSNFHQMIFDLLRVGCGAVPDPVFQCLQETDDPQFHVCCQWSTEERCKKVFAELQQAGQKGNAKTAKL